MMLRSFIALEIPAGIQAAIADSTASLKKACPKPFIRWVAPHNVHLTLKFLGDVSPANLERLAGMLKVESGLHEVFSMEAGDLGAFPNAHRARVIWIGLKAPASLDALWRGVEKTTVQMGYSPEGRPFSPHLTIGRVGQNNSSSDLQRVHAALSETKVGPLGTVRVEAVHIFKSDLQPGGSVYTCLYSLPLKSM
jgi:RNA 2',3'-cyclic 3'-phosphodiesterase